MGQKIRIKRLLISAVLVLLNGCGDYAAKKDEINVGVNDVVYEIYLKDGTRCAVLQGYRKGGLSCDWRTSNEPQN